MVLWLVRHQFAMYFEASGYDIPHDSVQFALKRKTLFV